MTRWAWVCTPCSQAVTKGGERTLESVANAGRSHGCFRVTKPATKREARNLVRVQVPALLTSEEWRTVWDGLDRPLDRVPVCHSARGSCGHAESSHRFATVSQAFCRTDRGGNPGNCVRCP